MRAKECRTWGDTPRVLLIAPAAAEDIRTCRHCTGVMPRARQATDRPTDGITADPAPSLHSVHSYALENLGRALPPSLPLECRRYGWFLRRFPSRKRFRTNHRKWLRRADGRSNQASREKADPQRPLRRDRATPQRPLARPESARERLRPLRPTLPSTP